MKECEICKSEITEKVAEYSMGKLGKYACYTCQKKKGETSEPVEPEKVEPVKIKSRDFLSVAVREANLFILAKNPDSVLSATKPEEWAKGIMKYSKALLLELEKGFK